MTIEVRVNGEWRSTDCDPHSPLLWYLRDELGLLGTKFGCGTGHCGACSVLDGDEAVRSCQTTLAAASGRSFTTIEGISIDGSHPVQQAWLAESVSQCGYCQPGMIVEAVAALRRNPRVSSAELERALGEHLCRCGSYPRLRRALDRLEAGR